MHGFKEWIMLQEAGFDDSGSNWFFGSYLYPSDAFDWQYCQAYPGDYLFMQSRWEGDREQGRKFINMDIDPIINQKFTSIQSLTMPGGDGSGSWTHSSDDRPNLKIVNDAKLFLMDRGKKSDDIQALVVSNDLLDKKEELNKLFGKFVPKYPQESEDFVWNHMLGK